MCKITSICAFVCVYSKKPVKQLMSNMGPVSKSGVDLFVADITGQRLRGNYRVGRLVRLKARLIGWYSYQLMQTWVVSPSVNVHWVSSLWVTLKLGVNGHLAEKKEILYKPLHSLHLKFVVPVFDDVVLEKVVDFKVSNSTTLAPW